MSSRLLHFSFIVFAVSILSSHAFSAGPTFRPDAVFAGSSLTGWHVLGQSDWKAQNGVLTGKAIPGSSGGWLVLDQSFQDVGFFASFECPAGCESGVLLRAEKTSQGLKGIYISLSEGDMASYRVTLDAQGKEIQREKITAPGGAFDISMLNYFNTAKPTGGAVGIDSIKTGAASKTVSLPPGVSLPGLEAPPSGVLKPGEWNTVNIICAWDNVTPLLNGGGLGAGGIEGGPVSDQDGKYGPIALYVGGAAEVQFKNIAYADLNRRQFPKEQTSPNWSSQRLSEWYYSYAAAASDINHDGIMDVLAGPYWYEGPDYTVAREIYQPATYNPTVDWPTPAMSQFSYDWTGDGWPEVLNLSGNAGAGVGTLFVNPKGESRRWDKYVVLPWVGNETTVFKDIDGDGEPEIIHATEGVYLAYSEPDPSDATKPWITKKISEAGPWGFNISHGLGVGDINGDGRADFLNTFGWWEQPPEGSSEKVWTYHAQAFGRWAKSAGGPGGAEIGVYDVNGDGLNDVVTALEGHGFGLAWFEQKRDGNGQISFEQHMIMDDFTTQNAGGVTFTEPHGTGFADLDGDGVPDFITAKSAEHHHGYTGDPDPYGPPVVYWYRTVRNPKAPGGAEFVPELIHNRSGVGDHFWIGDLNKDGRPDIVTSGAMGTFIFFNHTKKAPTPVAENR